MIRTPDGRPDKYAQIERERRYLLRRLPLALQGSGDYVRIIDRYLPESALRLRRMERPDGETVSLKLARKWTTPEMPPEETNITNLYLSPAGMRCWPGCRRRHCTSGATRCCTRAPLLCRSV